MNEDDLVELFELFEHISRQIGYAYDDLDEAALNGALDQTNDESADGWFLYPLAGTPPLTVRLAQSPRSGTVSAWVEGDMDPKLATRIETVAGAWPTTCPSWLTGPPGYGGMLPAFRRTHGDAARRANGEIEQRTLMLDECADGSGKSLG